MKKSCNYSLSRPSFLLSEMSATPIVDPVAFVSRLERLYSSWEVGESVGVGFKWNSATCVHRFLSEVLCVLLLVRCLTHKGTSSQKIVFKEGTFKLYY